VTAELGRIVFSIDNILKLGVGSVVELGRPVSDPIDSHGARRRFARGEVVVWMIARRPNQRIRGTEKE